MATITNRNDFTIYCKRRLGFPVIDINVDDDQVSDRIDDALQYWQDYHFDGLQKVYYIKALLQADVDNRYLDLSGSMDAQGNPMEIVGITRIFPVSDTMQSSNMFDLRYQLRLNELYDFTSASYINYTLTMQHLRSLEIMFTGEVPIRFQRHMQRLYIDWNWGQSEAPVGQVVVAECYAAINPDVYNRVWNDRWLKEYATALIKRDWGNNMKKFGGLQLPGGVTLNGKETWDEATAEIERLETEMEKNYGAPLEFFLN
ncbi:hypothetical protein UFOVP250_204 [uncultured Caudovirales phage]|uniref:Neck protein n=1 Tax=uncultured Caudovirales phage TaxID=2100421 RepID=A0A6J5LFX5_9CAUD|nr:hypothetical protein UFOVP250_204 [uncultured Caudovirales phage]